MFFPPAWIWGLVVYCFGAQSRRAGSCHRSAGVSCWETGFATWGYPDQREESQHNGFFGRVRRLCFLALMERKGSWFIVWCSHDANKGLISSTLFFAVDTILDSCCTILAARSRLRKLADLVFSVVDICSWCWGFTMGHTIAVAKCISGEPVGQHLWEKHESVA